MSYVQVQIRINKQAAILSGESMFGDITTAIDTSQLSAEQRKILIECPESNTGVYKVQWIRRGDGFLFGEVDRFPVVANPSVDSIKVILDSRPKVVGQFMAEMEESDALELSQIKAEMDEQRLAAIARCGNPENLITEIPEKFLLPGFDSDFISTADYCGISCEPGVIDYTRWDWRRGDWDRSFLQGDSARKAIEKELKSLRLSEQPDIIESIGRAEKMILLKNEEAAASLDKLAKSVRGKSIGEMRVLYDALRLVATKLYLQDKPSFREVVTFLTGLTDYEIAGMGTTRKLVKDIAGFKRLSAKKGKRKYWVAGGYPAMNEMVEKINSVLPGFEVSMWTSTCKMVGRDKKRHEVIHFTSAADHLQLSVDIAGGHPFSMRFNVGPVALVDSLD